MSGVEVAIIITGCVISIATLISTTLLHLRVKSSCCETQPAEYDERSESQLDMSVLAQKIVDKQETSDEESDSI